MKISPRAASRLSVWTCCILASAAMAWCGGAAGAAPPAAELQAPNRPNVSLRNEVRLAINKGLEWLEKNQNTNGYWSTAELPAITALDLAAFRMQPGARDQKEQPAAVKKGYAYLLSCLQPDGGIYRKELPSYNTSVSLMALTLADRPEYQAAIVNARKFIISLQAPGDQPGNPFAGGIGYGKQDKNPDLSNTSLALEALYFSKKYLRDKNVAEANDLDWKAAIHFIQSCQNLPRYNSESWVSGDLQNQGGFVYAPGRSMAGETNVASGRVALRSYGSMSYAGLLSYIYCDLKRDDPRVTAVLDWLRGNYTVDENPGMGPQGLFYYLHTMTKALTIYGADTLETSKGETVKWREGLAMKLINLQKADGSWANETGRWLEKDPALVTAYALIALDMIHDRI